MRIESHMNISAILIFSIPEHRIYLHLLVSSSISLMTVISFKVQIFQFLKFIPILFCFDAIVNEIVFLISFSDVSFLVYGLCLYVDFASYKFT